MALELTHEQEQLRDSVRAFLTKNADTEQALWEGLTGLGLTEIPFPERFGGAGCTLKDTSVVMHELGRTISNAPFFSSVCLAGLTLSECSSDTGRATHLPAIATGERIATLVAGYPYSDTPITANVTGNSQLILRGTREFVVDGANADLLVVVARGEKGLELAVIDGTTPGVVRTPLESLDTTRPLTRIEFFDAHAQAVGNPNLAATLPRAQASALVALASEQVGAAEACLEMSVEYAKNREQFGRPIGSFQSIKHRLTDILVALELAHAAVLDAANADDRPTDELATAASIAHVLASEAFTFAAEESIQIHGGIGFTWEHPLHRYFRRAKSDSLLFGSTETHHEVIAASVI
ncbi:alkylation response protein AidB-like acyl-CoA dehydrogenase [Rhodococcus wratislaviensis]|uniref:Acyl-CoA dehydrogenase n=1 Tax=Rhodococcus wratislaviensis TaxID=44752 RepID=A0AB38FNT0_RHOWR|nr:acyl-CoA dehydrogenase family protein [Rhodococcus wratislaviensis]REE71396.1 alkylation response protein AidB-like acyl-CoA dehydrogenase [Rhodococcus wratislaviensis]SPZ43275.1 acyl-CoA dehydrogenase [Rhodococcus wratislaviensis]